MSGAPIGRDVGLYIDRAIQVHEGDVLRRISTSPRSTTERAYRVLTVRVQERGQHVGRQHLRVLVIDPTTITDDDTVVDFVWYSRRRRR